MSSIVFALARKHIASFENAVLTTTEGVRVNGMLPATIHLASLVKGIATSPEIDAAVQQWIPTAEDLSRQLSTARDDVLSNINAMLAEKTFVVSNKLTLADLFLYSSLHTPIAHLNSNQRFQIPHVTRYFDLIQNLVHFHINPSKVQIPLKFIDIDLNAPEDPKPQFNPEDKKKKNNKAEAVTENKENANAEKKKQKDAQPAAPAADASKPKEAKKEKAPKEAKPASPAPGNFFSFHLISHFLYSFVLF